jgi:hypothetical protein
MSRRLNNNSLSFIERALKILTISLSEIAEISDFPIRIVLICIILTSLSSTYDDAVGVDDDEENDDDNVDDDNAADDETLSYLNKRLNNVICKVIRTITKS